MIRRKISVLITGIGGAAVGGQVLKALTMTENPYHIVGVNMSPYSYDLFEVDASYLVPSASSSSYIPMLKKICLKEKVEVLIPGSEQELLEISRNRQGFLEIGVFPIASPQKVIEICMDKWKTFHFLKSNGFNHPKTVLIEKESDISEVDFYPAVIKPARSSSGSRNVFLAQNDEEAGFFARFLRKQGSPPLVQEYVGSCDEEYSVSVLTLPSGEIVGSIALRRFLIGMSRRDSVMSYKGLEDLAISTSFSQGEIKDFREIREYSEAIATKLGVHGPVNIQGRNTKNGFFPFEINPRFSGGTSIRALVGFNEPDFLIRYFILGEKPSKINFKKGFVMRGLAENYISFGEIRKLKKKDFHSL
jgi:carbamoyl-phosphate synthase large subunit